MRETIAKSDWLAVQKCKAKAWYGLRSPQSLPTEGEVFRTQQGQEVGALARRLYPDGILVSQSNGKTPSEITKTLIRDNSTRVIFEATAISNRFVAKADILLREDGGWHILEVKSSFTDADKLKDLRDDLAYTVTVFRLAGIQVTRASLLLLSRAFRFGDSPDCLFDLVELTKEVLARAAEFELVASACAIDLFSTVSPMPELVSACRECSAFTSECLGVGIKHTVFEIPNLHYKKLARLSAEGIVDLASVPHDLGLNERQQRARDSAVTGKLLVEDGLGNALQQINWPCHYLDFETVATVLPLYPRHGCHDQVLTQFSIHHRESISAEPRHSEFLADASRDCQRELAEALISALGQQGSVLVYTSFERKRIEALQTAFPDLANCLKAIQARLVDLHPLIADYVYHPDFRGSFSIKVVLPTLAPDLSYQECAIRDGDAAITRFARMARGNIPATEISLTRLELLHYCKIDTLAMVRLHEALSQLASA